MNCSNDTCHLKLKSSFEELERIVAEAEAFFQPRVNDEDAVYNLVLLASEAVTNAIEHGNRGDETRSVEVWLKVEGRVAEVTVEDEGEGFRPENVENPLAPEHLLDDGGRGVFLMGELADEVSWSKGGRSVTLRLNLDRPSP